MVNKGDKVEKGDSGREPKLHQMTEWRKKPWENPGSVGGQFSSGQQMNSV